eukprot:3452872-Lingulodinium_polyedra.AAC.1
MLGLVQDHRQRGKPIEPNGTPNRPNRIYGQFMADLWPIPGQFLVRPWPFHGSFMSNSHAVHEH